jgi:hypothetical protein
MDRVGHHPVFDWRSPVFRPKKINIGFMGNCSGFAYIYVGGFLFKGACQFLTVNHGHLPPTIFPENLFLTSLNRDFSNKI